MICYAEAYNFFILAKLPLAPFPFPFYFSPPCSLSLISSLPTLSSPNPRSDALLTTLSPRLAAPALRGRTGRTPAHACMSTPALEEGWAGVAAPPTGAAGSPAVPLPRRPGSLAVPFPRRPGSPVTPCDRWRWRSCGRQGPRPPTRAAQTACAPQLPRCPGAIRRSRRH